MRIIKLIDLPLLRDELAAKTQIGNRHFTKAQLSFPATNGSGFVLQELMNSTGTLLQQPFLSGAAIFIFCFV